jgi:hypothetical protein
MLLRPLFVEGMLAPSQKGLWQLPVMENAWWRSRPTREAKFVDQDPLEVQVLKLLKAFFEIENPNTRQAIVTLTESRASEDSFKAEASAHQKPSETKLN